MAGRKSSTKRVQADKNYIEVLGKLFTVLEYFVERGNRQESVAFVEIAGALPFARTTVHRILYSLEKLGYIEKDNIRGRYQLAEKFFELTGQGANYRRLQSVAKSVMQRLVFNFGETVNLGVIDDAEVAYIDVVQSTSTLRIAAIPGERHPLHCTSLGKAMLAFYSEHEIVELLRSRPLIRRTPKTITQREHLLEHLSSVRERGVAFDMEENVSGVLCLAAPIFDQTGNAIAAISISGPTSRMEPKLGKMEEEVRTAGKEISRMLSPNVLSQNGKVASPSPATKK